MDEKKRSVVSWWMYDWANSAFILTVAAAFFPVFFKSFWCTGVDATISTARLGTGNAVAGLLVAVLSPLLGVIADAGGVKKKLLAAFMITGSLSTILLCFVPQGGWLVALLLFMVASVGYNGGNIFYDALLVDVAEKERMDWVSSVGYGVGYLGCGLLFALNVVMVNQPLCFGLHDASSAVRISFVISALWWMIFSLPLFFNVKEARYRTPVPLGVAARNSIAQAVAVAKKIVLRRRLFIFMIAYWLYIDGVHTFVLMATDFGMSIGIKATSLMIALLVVQFVGVPSSLLFGWLAKSTGAHRMILVGIAIYIGVCGIGAFFLHTARGYLILAGVTGVAQGGIQALSRSHFGKMIPHGEAAEYFGFFNIVNRFAVIFGPLVVGTVAVGSKMAGLPSMLASRVGMASVSVLFIAGAVMLIQSMNVKDSTADDR